MIKRYNEKTGIFKKRYSLMADLTIYQEAFDQTHLGLEEFANGTLSVFNKLSYLLKYYTHRKKECVKPLKYIKRILDDFTVVECVETKRVCGKEKCIYKFTSFNLPEETKELITKQYKQLTQEIYQGIER